MFNNTGYIVKLRKSRALRGIATLFLLSIITEIIQPTVSLALTEGPSQPEVQSFEPIGTTQMVDLFTGDFNYNIPLFNLPGPNGGYPVNLSYHAGVSMDDEASWVGLGWNINAGSLVRNMRGLPDEFLSETVAGSLSTAKDDHDYLEVKQDMKQNMTFGVRGSHKWEFLGAKASPDNFSLAASIYYNNYRGFGASLDPSLGWEGNRVEGGLGLSLDSENGLGVSATLGIKDETKRADAHHQLAVSFDGDLSVDYSLRMDEVVKRKEYSWDLGRRLSSESRYKTGNFSSFGSSISFARSSFSPSLAFQMTNWSFSGTLSPGDGISGFFAASTIGVFFNTQDFDELEKNGRKHAVIGYDKSGENNSSFFSRDFSRERDGQVTAGTQFLPVSNYTYDTYSSTGQGLSGYFRPRRNDVGRSFDPEKSNKTFGASLGIELEKSNPTDGIHAGLDNLGLIVGNQVQKPWNGGNDNNSLDFDFSNPSAVSSSDYAAENLYYAAHGEQTIVENSDIAYMMGLDLPALRFAPKGANVSNGYAYGGKRHLTASVNDNRYAQSKGSSGSSESDRLRTKRNTTIHNLRNKEVAGIGEFQIKYYNWSSSLDLGQNPSNSLDRTVRNGGSGSNVNIENHYAGFKVLNEEGAYYVYGLPAYNTKEVSNLFSTTEKSTATAYSSQYEDIDTKNGEVDYKSFGKGHQYINKRTTSPYAHSYLLTSVQGADYVDLTNNGPSDDDLGYWVKFDYVKSSTDNYKWRSPYNSKQAYFSKGAAYTNEDDKASYQYGEKELWYMGRMETKTHIAIFHLKQRKDMVGAATEMTDHNNSEPIELSARDKSLYLEKISVYEKKSFQQSGTNARPLQEVHFAYNYDLCDEVPNNTNSQTLNSSELSNTGGKLTLKNVWFTSNGSTRGSLNKYTFDYSATNVPITTYQNPNFSDGAYDSWGTYKPRSGHEFASNFPYVNQFNQDWNSNAWEPAYGNDLQNQAAKDLTKNTQDALASAWCLRKITLPSGGTIDVQYESDDYGYVQHKTANQMFKITRFGYNPSEPNRLFNQNENSDDFEANPEKRRVYFKLEEPIPTSLTEQQRSAKVYDDYVKPIHAENGFRNLYFKAKIDLTSNVYDYVSGYLPLEQNLSSANGTLFYGTTNTAIIDGEECHTEGFVTLRTARKARNPFELHREYHPMSLAAWTYLQTDAQELLMNDNSFDTETDGDVGVFKKIGDFFQIAPAVAQAFGSIRNYCRRKGMAENVDLDYSCIRLASPDKIKYGGGHRVKQISITDNWSASTNDSDRTYGQTFEYTITENGRKISSGVAQYEPQAGGDENALKYPYYFAEKQTFFTRNNLFAEAPFNESLFPGASVGYRKVTVKSLNTNTQMTRQANNQTGQGRTGGVTEHEFYTAKDFPTRVFWSLLAEENSTKDVYNLPILIPLIGSLQFKYYHGTQAYKIELNDMHGKPKSVKSYELDDYYQLHVNPITESLYEYQCHQEEYMGEKVFVLDNEVPIIKNDDTYDLYKENNVVAKKLMGVEVDLYTDQRESKSFHCNPGMDFNVDVMPFPIPLLDMWPSYSSQKSLFRTYVTNKVVHKSGILKRTKVRDLQTVNESEIVAYDERSGMPVLTKIKNEFGDDFYSYNIPAYYAYDRMGHAYRNIDYRFATTITNSSAEGTCYYTFPVGNTLNNLVRGDELLVSKLNSNNVTEYFKGYFLGWKYDANGATKGMIHFPYTNPGSGSSSVAARVIRSGRRNHYTANGASYLTKGTIPENGLSQLTNVTNASGQTFTKAKKINQNVLSATANLYSDDWADEKQGEYSLGSEFVEGRYINFESFSNLNVSNPFVSGNSGIWRPYKSYTYVGKRKTSGAMSTGVTEANPQLYNDGVFDEAVPLFTWELGALEEYVPSSGTNPYKNWEWVNEVTRFSSDAYELENVNRLGIFSSALYGYGNSLSIAVGGNASYYEMGVLDFESVNPNQTLAFGETMKQNNLNVYNNTTGRPAKMLIAEKKNILHATYSSNGELLVTFRFKSSTERSDFVSLLPLFYSSGQQQISDGFESMFGLSLVSKAGGGISGNQSFFLNGKYVSNTTSGLPSTDLNVTLKPFICAETDALHYLKPGTYYHGKATMLQKRKVSTVPLHNNVSFTPVSGDSKKAHTGKIAMKVSGDVIFDQPKIKILTGKSYVISAWISRQNTDVKTYKPSSGAIVQACMMDVNSGGLSNPFLEIPDCKYTYGKVIEGWQKVDVEFKVTAGSEYENKILGIRFIPGASVMYVDDIRISPKTGGMQTYVYDPVNFWLRASLNVDNYATLFYYDEEGSLTLKKQETEKGIFTIQESRSRIKH